MPSKNAPLEVNPLGKRREFPKQMGEEPQGRTKGRDGDGER